ncbi:unnamed protein product [Closterium sp. Naga37s-1]|nr:unnamed protein product [Closterium sp. Naga37s-1]
MRVLTVPELVIIPLRASSSPLSRVSPLAVYHPHFSVPSRPLDVPLGRYLPSIHTLRVACEARREEREGLDQAAEDEAREGSKPSGSDNEVVTAVSGAMARSFGGPLWFAVLLSSILVFGGGYGYLLYSNADIAGIPMLTGPLEKQRVE